MDDSERIERLKSVCSCELEERRQTDEAFANRIAALLNHPKIDQYCMVDAYYYDFAVIPKGVQKDLDLWRDCYLIYGITIEGEMVSKWVERYDLDSTDPIVNGKVIHKPYEPGFVPEIRQSFDRNLLRTPIPDIFKFFGVKDEK